MNPSSGKLISTGSGAEGSAAKRAARRSSPGKTTWLAGMAMGLLLCGCVSRQSAAWLTTPLAGAPPREFTAAQMSVTNIWPPEYRAIQRAIITVGRKQFVCDGVLDVDPGGGWHLAVVSPLGLVSEVRLTADGKCEVLKVTPLFSEWWSRDYIARDLRWHFLPPGDNRPGGYGPDGRPMLESNREGQAVRWMFSRDGQRWQELEISRQGRRLYWSRLGQYRRFPGWPQELPTDFRLEAGHYQLHLRIVNLTLPGRQAEPGEKR